MHSQGNKFWNEITNHQFCFDRPQLEVEIIKTLERTDLIHFYDHYISPRSIHRRKLALHVNPSALALQTPCNEVAAVESEDEIAVIIGGELPSTIDEEHKEADVVLKTEISHETVQLTKQPSIIDPLVDKETEKVLPKKEINFPKGENIDNVHVWKSKLPCYPLAQSYEKIDIPVLCKL